MFRFFNKSKGTISVFLCLILLPTILVGGMTVDASRIYLSKVVISDAGEMAMNAGLAQYNEILHDEYGLLVMDQSPTEMKSDLESYFEQSLNTLPSDTDYQKILDLTKKNFEAINVIGSEIYRTDVEKQQIIEYMKYRAPVCLTELVVEKFQQLRDTQKMVDAMNAEMDFSIAMQDCQDAFKDAKEALDALNQIIENYPSDDTIRQELENTRKDFTEIVSRNFLMAEALENYNGSTESTDLKAMAEACIEAGKLNLSGLSENERKERTFDAYMVCKLYMNTVNNLGGIGALLTQYDAEKAEQEAAENADKAENGEGAEGEQQVQETPQPDQARNDLQQIESDYNTQARNIDDFIKNLRDEARQTVDTHAANLNSYNSLAGAAVEAAKKAEKELTDIRDLLKTASDKFNVWDQKNNDLKATGKSGDMDRQIEEYRGFFSTDGAADVQQLEELLNAVKMNHNYFKEVADILKKEKFHNQVIATEPAENQKGTYKNAARNALNGSETTWSEIEPVWVSYNEQYEHTALSLNYVKQSIKNDAFYNSLQQYCAGNKSDGLENETNDVNNKLSQGAAAGEEAMKEDGYPTYNWGEAGELISSLTGDDAPNADDKVGDINGGSNMEDAGQRRNIVSKFQESIQAANSFLTGIDGIIAKALENLYVVEYAMQMFSYYTINVEDGHTRPAEDIISLSGYSLQDRPGYRGECEYILWGNDESQTNVRNTMMLIFGIRLLFNSFYAFTDYQIDGTATYVSAAVGVYAPYLVPLVKVVIKLAFAGAETASDMKWLKQGYGVTILKDSSTWSLRGGNNRDGVTFDYSEYLRVFLNVSMAGNEVGILARIADCIQVNEPDIDLRNSYTMLAVKAEVSTRTTFMRKISDWGGNGSWGFPEDSYTIDYQSILGY